MIVPGILGEDAVPGRWTRAPPGEAVPAGLAQARGRSLGASATASGLKAEEEGLLLRLGHVLSTWTVNTRLLVQDGSGLTAGKTSDPLQPPHMLQGPLPSAHRGPQPLWGHQVLPLDLLKLSPKGRIDPDPWVQCQHSR